MLIIQSFLLFFFTLNLLAYPDTSQVVKEKRIYPMGKKVYEKLCQSIEPKQYKSYAKMQEAIRTNKMCKKMREEHFEALSLYLWDLKRAPQQKIHEHEISITKKEKCPICGMYVYKYPKWATQIFYDDTHYSFDGVKDMLKYYFTHEEGVSKILVRDYYTQKVIEARAAFFVVGSDIYGPMGNELIVFSDEESAKVFYFDHRAKSILAFKEITFDLVDSL